MADIKRYSIRTDSSEMNERAHGQWVRYSDHLAAIQAAVAAEREACAKIARRHNYNAADEIRDQEK